MLRYFLGIEITWAATGICLSQRKYTLQLLDDTCLLASKPASTPMDPRIQINSTDGEIIPNHSQYRHIVGRLLDHTLSRPDITFAVHKLSQFISMQQVPHLQDVHHLLRYLKGMLGQGIFFSASSSLHYEHSLMPIGRFPWQPQVHDWFLYIFRRLFCFWEIQETVDCVSFFRQGRISGTSNHIM